MKITNGLYEAVMQKLLYDPELVARIEKSTSTQIPSPFREDPKFLVYLQRTRSEQIAKLYNQDTNNKE